MPRIARMIAVDYPHHVVQAGNNRNKVFFDEKDMLVYLGLLKKYTEKWVCPVLAYCVMPDHVHLLVKPREDNSLSKQCRVLRSAILNILTKNIIKAVGYGEVVITHVLLTKKIIYGQLPDT
ncbi:MAG: transposase [Candidatus Mariimomonas ferrooxydans]